MNINQIRWCGTMRHQHQMIVNTRDENGNSSVCHHHTHVKIRVMTIVAANNDIYKMVFFPIIISILDYT